MTKKTSPHELYLGVTYLFLKKIEKGLPKEKAQDNLGLIPILKENGIIKEENCVLYPHVNYRSYLACVSILLRDSVE